MEENQVSQENQQSTPENKQSAESPSQKQFSPMLIGAILVAVVLVIGGFVLSRSRTQTSESTQGIETQTQQQEVTTPEVTSETSEVTVIEVEGGAFYDKPNEIRVKQGETVRIVFTNAGGTHDFTIDEFNVKTKTTQTGETAEVEFVASQTGEFEFYCGVGNHRAQGVKGTLIVE